MNRKIIIADNQYITKVGIRHEFLQLDDFDIIEVTKKKTLLAELDKKSRLLVVLDYTIFDFQSADELLNLGTAYPNVHWLLFSVELSDEFIRRTYFNSTNFSIIYKDSSGEEIKNGLAEVIKNHRYVCSLASNVLLNNVYKQYSEIEKVHLTSTEKKILKEIASGKTTKEIAELRHSSIHTIISHRKNIFRKISVNNIHEATKYAVRAGLVDLSDYFI